MGFCEQSSQGAGHSKDSSDAGPTEILTILHCTGQPVKQACLRSEVTGTSITAIAVEASLPSAWVVPCLLPAPRNAKSQSEQLQGSERTCFFLKPQKYKHEVADMCTVFGHGRTLTCASAKDSLAPEGGQVLMWVFHAGRCRGGNQLWKVHLGLQVIDQLSESRVAPPLPGSERLFSVGLHLYLHSEEFTGLHPSAATSREVI